MRRKNWIIFALVLSVLIYQAGIWLVIIHHPIGHLLRKTGFYLSIFSTVMGIVELLHSAFAKNK
jgi:hypothetical protein